MFMADGPQDRYLALCASAELTRDAAQEAAVRRLQALAETLRHYRLARRSALASLIGRKPVEPPRGVYLHGPVGGGKSLLMDLFFETAAVERKRRVHFHAFMQEVHRLIHEERQSGRHAEERDTIGAVADELAERAWLLCFDELHVTDIADAMILGRLFDKLFARGVVVVATSNRAPRELYEGGINRQLFLPFIAMIEERMETVALMAERDYRLALLAATDLYRVPADAAARAAIDATFRRLIGGAEAEPLAIEVQGRSLVVPRQARHVARFAFEELCARPLGAADYLALAGRFHTLVIDGIPRMAGDMRNEASRFATLIDVLYENGVGLVCSADAEPQELHAEGDGAVAFSRTASRLVEMRSADYLAGQRRALRSA